jgi:hypothetical protein
MLEIASACTHSIDLRNQAISLKTLREGFTILQQLWQRATILLIMKIVYRVSEQDVADAHNLVTSEGHWYDSSRSLPWFGAFVLAAEVYYLIVEPHWNMGLVVIGVAVGLPLLCSGLALGLYVRRAYHKDHRFKHEFTADVSDQGIVIVTPFSNGLVKWNAFERFLESNDIFMLLITQRNFIVVPKRAFAHGEIDEFRSLLQGKIASTG